MSSLEEYDRDNRNAFGKVYYPTQKYGVRTFHPDGSVLSSVGCYCKARAVEIAEEHVKLGGGRSATVFRRCNPRCLEVLHLTS